MTGKTYDHATLKALIDEEPANAGKSDADVLAWLKEPVSTYGRAQVSDLVQYLAESGIWAAMAASDNATVKGVFAELSYLTTQPMLETIDVRSSRFDQAMNAIVAAGIATTKQKSDVEGLAPTNTKPRHAAISGRCVLGDVIYARSL